MNPIQLNAILGRVATKADGSLSLNFSTSEMTAEETTVLIKLARLELSMLLTPKHEPLEAPVEVKSGFHTKTPAARIRAVLFVLFKYEIETNKLPKESSFEPFYQQRCEKIIDWLKTKLPEQ